MHFSVFRQIKEFRTTQMYGYVLLYKPVLKYFIIIKKNFLKKIKLIKIEENRYKQLNCTDVIEKAFVIMEKA